MSPIIQRPIRKHRSVELDPPFPLIQRVVLLKPTPESKDCQHVALFRSSLDKSMDVHINPQKLFFAFGKISFPKDRIAAIGLIHHGDTCTVVFWYVPTETMAPVDEPLEIFPVPDNEPAFAMPCKPFPKSDPAEGPPSELSNRLEVSTVGMMFQPDGKAATFLRDAIANMGYTVYEFSSWNQYWQAIGTRR